MSSLPSTIRIADWFDLRHYEATSTWSLDSWYRAFSNRKAMKSRRLGGDEGGARHLAGYFEGIAVNVMMPTALQLINPARYTPLSGHLLASPAVVDISSNRAMGDYYYDHWRSNEDMGEPQLQSGDHTARFLVVDLSAPDVVLERQFKEWLKSTRKSSPESERASEFTSVNMRAWTDARVLPYLDLCCWRDIHRARLTQAEMATLLFPDDYETVDVVERLRKVTHRHAVRLTSAPMFNRLATQVADAWLQSPEAEAERRAIANLSSGEPEPF